MEKAISFLKPSTTSTSVLFLFTSILLLLQPMVSSSWIFHSRLFLRQQRQIGNSLNFSFRSSSSPLLTNLYSTTTAATTNTAANRATANSLRMAASSTKGKVATTQIPCPPAENDEDDYSLYHLQQRTQWLIENHEALGKVCLSIAGGGGHALSTLAATAGASQLLLEGTVTYDRASFQNYVGRALPNDKSFSFSSLEAAKLSSESALLQGMQLRSRNMEGKNTLFALRDTVGLGSASTLKTTTTGGMSRTGRPSHGNIVATRSNGTQVCMKLILNCPTQNRFQQDVFCSHMILQTLEELAKIKDKTATNSSKIRKYSDLDVDEIIDPTEFNGVTIEQWQTEEAKLGGDDQDTTTTTTVVDPVISAANRILSGVDEAVLLLPKGTTSSTTSSSSSQSTTTNDFLEPLLFPVLPDNCLIFPGSFNPPHKGHLGLARAAIAKLSESDEALRPLVFEISITNADKPAMDPEEVSRRVAQFRDILYETTNGDGDDQGIPEWGVLLTSAPLFADKVRMLRHFSPTSLQPHSKFPVTEDETTKSRRWSFVIGTDTMVRVLNPKYYKNDYNNMLEAQRSMGADFVVGGRLDQSDQGSSETFVTGDTELDGLPPDVKDMFVLLGESDFRMDISSTELRSQGQQI